MNEGKAKANDDTGSPIDANDPPPGPTDHGREGGMATREVAPDVVAGRDEPPD